MKLVNITIYFPRLLENVFRLGRIAQYSENKVINDIHYFI